MPANPSLAARCLSIQLTQPEREVLCRLGKPHVPYATPTMQELLQVRMVMAGMRNPLKRA